MIYPHYDVTYIDKNLDGHLTCDDSFKFFDSYKDARKAVDLLDWTDYLETTKVTYEIFKIEIVNYDDELEESKKSAKRNLNESHKYNDSISLYDNLYNYNPKEMTSDDFLADLLDFAEMYNRDYNKKIDELIDMDCGEWFDYIIEYSLKAK